MARETAKRDETILVTRDDRKDAWDLAEEYRDKIRELHLPLRVGVRTLQVAVTPGNWGHVYGVYVVRT